MVKVLSEKSILKKALLKGFLAPNPVPEQKIVERT